MEFLFSDTVTRMSTRVIQLENRMKQNERDSTKHLDDCGGALDFDHLDSVGKTDDKPRAGGAKLAVLQPGGRVRVDHSGSGQASQGSGLVYSASGNSILGGGGAAKTTKKY